MCKIIPMPTPTATHGLVNLGFKKHGRTHAALLMAKSLRRRFTVEDLREISPTVFADGKRASQSLCLLVKHGFLDKTEQGWQITPKGVEHLYKSATTNKLAAAEFSKNGY